MAKATQAQRTRKTSKVRRSRTRRGEPLLLEIAWEVCNQLGGIYTVIRSKVPNMIEQWGNRYVAVGPYTDHAMATEFEPAPLTGAMGQVVKALREQGLEAHYGRWLVTGRPHVVLLDYRNLFGELDKIKYRLWNEHDIPTPADDEMINDVVAFGEACRRFLQVLAHRESGRRPIIAHFHEWMAGTAIPMLRQEQWPGSIVFTTHATLLGRYLAMNDSKFYEHLQDYHADTEAEQFNVTPQYRIERAAAHGAQVFTTVSDVTAEECRHLLGRSPDVLLPNGLNIKRFAAVHEFQNLHRDYKEQLHEFTIGHFFPSYHFDLDNTIYMFTSGRYEFQNKGMDLTIEALARLNHRLQVTGSKKTVVAFIITKRPVRSLNVGALSTHAMRKEFHTISEAIKEQIGDRLFQEAAKGTVPDFNQLVDEYWLVRLKRMIHVWKRELPPGVVTHDLVDDSDDAVLDRLRTCQLWNQKDSPVKVIYHPDFITPTNPLFGLEYEQFVRACHLGIFPSYYEPWGYTPLECAAMGIPAVTSDLSGFGSYLNQVLEDHEDKGLYVVNRRHHNWFEAAEQLTDFLFEFVGMNRRERVANRNRVEAFSPHFDWGNLGKHYQEAYAMALERID